MFEPVISRIRPLDVSAMEKCQVRLDNLTKPLGSLHSFEHLTRKMAGITANPRIRELLPKLVVLNGSCRTAGLLDVFAENLGAEIVTFDLDATEIFCREQAALLLEKGIKIACSQTEAGAKVIGVGWAGTKLPFSAVAGIQAWYGSEKQDVLEQLAAVGSPALAGLTGIILGAAASGAAVVLDDAPTGAAALVAAKMAPQVKDYLVGSHLAEPSHGKNLQLLGIPAYLNLGLNVGEGVGAALGISLIQASLHVLHDMKTFGEAEVHVAEDGPGALVQNPTIRD